MRRLVIGFTLICFVTTQTTALAQPHDEGTAAGQAANTAAKTLIDSSTASQVVPGYTNTPPEAVSPYDPAVLAARRIAANPAATLEDISTYYSGCQVDTIATL